MELEIKPVYNDFYNKILETSDNNDNDNHDIDSHSQSQSQSQSQSRSHLSGSELSNKLISPKFEKKEKSSELSKEEVFKKLNKIIQAENPKNINLNTKENKPNIKNSTNKVTNKIIPNKVNKQNEKSDNYTNSSGLGEDDINFKNMYLQNMQRMQTANNNIGPKQNNFEYHSSSEQKNINSDENIKNNKKNTNMFGNQVKKSKKIDSGSLLDTNSDSDIRNKNNIIYEPNKDDSSVASEFKQFFSKNRKAKLDDGKEKDNNQKQLEKLEKYYDKAIEKKHKNKETPEINNKNKDKKEEVIDEKKYKKKDVVKLMLNSVEKKIFEESTRGFNLENSIYKLDMQKLKTNLFNFKIDKDSKCTIGYLYRNFLNPKIYNTINNETSFWIETTKISNSTNLIETELEPKNKFLLACLKNFKKTKKFKKQIGSNLFRANIKTVELLNTPNKLIIDIIFFTKYKIQ